MPWKCPSCGVEGLDDLKGSHSIESGGCGYTRFPSGVVLLSKATGIELALRVSTTLGQAGLRALNREELRYLSAEQFRIEKSEERGGWVLRHVSLATNPTYLNAATLPPEGSVLKTGDEVSIKGLYFRLGVRLLD